MPDGVLKSHSVFKNEHLELAINLACDCGLSEHDRTTITERVNREGISFLTITLPRLTKALLSGVSSGSFQTPNGFKTLKNSPIPAFMQELFLDVFDIQGTYLENDASDKAFRMIYQFCSFFYKAKMEFSDDQISEYSDKFVATDAQLADIRFDVNDSILRTARNFITDIFSDFDPTELICKDGPGSTSNCRTIEKKTKRLSSYKCTSSKYLSLFFMNDTHELDSMMQYPNVYDVQDQVSKVLFVPKDSRGPRVISAEPRECQWIQQGLRRYMYEQIEKSPYVNGEIQFSDQTRNGDLALKASVDRELSTLDLSEASDRISLSLVKSLFSGVPQLLEYMLVSRSDKTALPDGRIITLNKFAPMGSAICFPVLSVVIWSLIKARIHLETCDVGPEYFPNFKMPDEGVYVFGDDIIVDTYFTTTAISTLERYGLKVNRDKSFVASDFAESCGVDAYKGRQVTPVRLRETLYRLPKKKRGYHWPNLKTASHIETCNQLAEKGYYGAALYLANLIEANHGAIPFGYEFDAFLNFRKGTILERLRASETPRKIGYWTVRPVKANNQDETGWSHFLRTIHSLGTHAEIPDYGVHDVYRSAKIAKCKRPSVFYDYPAATWLPDNAKHPVLHKPMVNSVLTTGM